MADGDQTIVLTSTTRAKINNTSSEDVWEMIITSTFDDDDDSLISAAIPLNGILRHITVVIPDTTTDSTTSQILITDDGGNTVFDTGEIAEGETHNFSVDLPLSGVIGVSVEPSAAAGSGGNETVITLRGV